MALPEISIGYDYLLAMIKFPPIYVKKYYITFEKCYIIHVLLHEMFLFIRILMDSLILLLKIRLCMQS